MVVIGFALLLFVIGMIGAVRAGCNPIVPGCVVPPLVVVFVPGGALCDPVWLVVMMVVMMMMTVVLVVLLLVVVLNRTIL